MVVDGELSETDDGREGREATSRLCAVTRAELPIAELIRFVAGPEGVIVPDLARKLPGRGVWVTADRTTVAQAQRANAFAKSLKRPVVVPPDLAGQVEEQLVRRLAGALSIANKAGLAMFGFDKIDAGLGSGRIAVLVHGADAAEGGRDKLDRKHRAVAEAAGRDATVVDLLTIDQISLAFGRTNVVHAGLTRGGATDKVVGEAGRLKRYRCA